MGGCGGGSGSSRFALAPAPAPVPPFSLMPQSAAATAHRIRPWAPSHFTVRTPLRARASERRGETDPSKDARSLRAPALLGVLLGGGGRAHAQADPFDHLAAHEPEEGQEGRRERAHDALRIVRDAVIHGGARGVVVKVIYSQQLLVDPAARAQSDRARKCEGAVGGVGEEQGSSRGVGSRERAARAEGRGAQRARALTGCPRPCTGSASPGRPCRPARCSRWGSSPGPQSG